MTDREQFEAWASDNNEWPQCIERSGDSYKLMQTKLKWEAWQARAQTAQAVPLLSDAEWLELATNEELALLCDVEDVIEICRAAEQAVRAKLGVAVPMPGDQIFRIARRLAPKVIDGMVYVPEWIVPLVRAVEESHGIVGKEGGNV